MLTRLPTLHALDTLILTLKEPSPEVLHIDPVLRMDPDMGPCAKPAPRDMGLYAKRAELVKPQN